MIDMVSPNIIKLDHKNKEHVAAAAGLHTELLHGSLVRELGFQFMTKFYYSRLIRDGLMSCDLYRYKSRYVGWILYTKYPFTYMQQGKKNNFVLLSFILLLTIIRRPSCVKVFWELSKFNAIRSPGAINAEGSGEFLSFGVLKEYRRIRDKITGLRISRVLFNNALDYFKDEGYNRMLLFVNRQNKAALRFYEHYAAHEVAEGNEEIRILAIDL